MSPSEPSENADKDDLGCFRRYFWRPQDLNAATSATDLELARLGKGASAWRRFVASHRALLGIGLPALFWHAIWWPVMAHTQSFGLFKDYFYASVIMVFGSLVAGCTSEGGAAVAFPVLTLAFKVSPIILRVAL